MPVLGDLGAAAVTTRLSIYVQLLCEQWCCWGALPHWDLFVCAPFPYFQAILFLELILLCFDIFIGQHPSCREQNQCLMCSLITQSITVDIPSL